VADETYLIDGEEFDDLGGYYEVVGRALIPGQPCPRNLDAFNDFLFWLCEDKGPYTLIWRNSALSRQNLGHEAMACKLEAMLKTCHPSNIPLFRQRLDRARRGEGPTLFDWLVEIIEDNKDFVRLRLE
jgi:Barstar (barnase inhibitor)